VSQIVCAVVIATLMDSPGEFILPYSRDVVIGMLSRLVESTNPLAGLRRKKLLGKQKGECRAGKSTLQQIYVVFCFGCGYKNVILLANLEKVNESIPGVRTTYGTIKELFTSYMNIHRCDTKWDIFIHSDFGREQAVITALDNPESLVLLVTHTADSQPLRRIISWFEVEERRKCTALVYDEVHNTMTERPADNTMTGADDLLDDVVDEGLQGQQPKKAKRRNQLPDREAAQASIMYLSTDGPKQLRFDFTLFASASQMDVDAFINAPNRPDDQDDIDILEVLTDNNFLRANGFIGMVDSFEGKVALSGVVTRDLTIKSRKLYGREKSGEEYTLADADLKAALHEAMWPPEGHHFGERRIAIEFGSQFVDATKSKKHLTVEHLARSIGRYYSTIEQGKRQAMDLLVVSISGAGCKVEFRSDGVNERPSAPTLRRLLEAKAELRLFTLIYIVTNLDNRGSDFNHLGGGHTVSHVLVSIKDLEVWSKVVGPSADIQRIVQMLGRANRYTWAPLHPNVAYVVACMPDVVWTALLAYLGSTYKGKLDISPSDVASFEAVARHGGAKVGKDSEKQRSMTKYVMSNAPPDFSNRARKAMYVPSTPSAPMPLALGGPGPSAVSGPAPSVASGPSAPDVPLQGNPDDMDKNAFLLVLALHNSNGTGATVDELVKLIGSDMKRWRKEYQSQIVYKTTGMVVLKDPEFPNKSNPARQEKWEEEFDSHLDGINAALPFWENYLDASQVNVIRERIAESTERARTRSSAGLRNPPTVSRKRTRAGAGDDAGDDAGAGAGAGGGAGGGDVPTMILLAMYNGGSPRVMSLAQLRAHHPLLLASLGKGNRWWVNRLTHAKPCPLLNMVKKGSGKYELTDAGVQRARELDADRTE
jgi:hypothetical protein